MTKAKAAKLIKQAVKEDNGIVPTVKWLTWGRAKYPTGLTGHYGRVELSAPGYRTTQKMFTSTSDGGWLLK